jgi:hypothetical protein
MYKVKKLHQARQKGPYDLHILHLGPKLGVRTKCTDMLADCITCKSLIEHLACNEITLFIDNNHFKHYNREHRRPWDRIRCENSVFSLANSFR